MKAPEVMLELLLIVNFSYRQLGLCSDGRAVAGGSVRRSRIRKTEV